MRTLPDHLPSALPVRQMLGVLAALFACLAPMPLPAQEPKPQAAEPVTPAEPEVAAISSPLTTFGRQIPAMRPNRGVWIPSFANGTLSSLVEADVVTRVDDNRLEADNMKIKLYGADPKENVEIDLKSATYHMTHQILRSDERSKVSRMDFDLEGDSLIFDTITSQGRMTGNVRMTIHDARGFMESMNKPATTEAKAESAAADPNSTAPVPPATATATSSSSRGQAKTTLAPKP